MEFSKVVLSSLIWCPIIGALIVAFLPRRVAREGAFVVALCNLLFALHLPSHWASGALTQFAENGDIAAGLPFGYRLGVDGLSMPMVLLTAFMTPLVLLLSWNAFRERDKAAFALLLLLEAAVIGVFCARDLILFYIFFEATLIPTYLLIAGWGGVNRNRAALKFFLYTMLGSILMLVAMIYVFAHQTGPNPSFEYEAMRAAANNLEAGPGAPLTTWLFAAFCLAFAVKSPLFPFHTWLPDTYAEAPTPATVMLAAVLSKMGVYGFIRFALPLFPRAAQEAAPLLMGLAVVGIIYGAFVAIAQTDIKRVLAYSSLSHIGFILLGVFAASAMAGEAGASRTSLPSALSATALSGATLQMVSHALTTGALFLLAGLLFERRATNAASATNESDARQVRDFGGLAGVMPRYTVFFWFALFASIGLPGLCNFVGEYLILQGTMNYGGTGSGLGAGFLYAALAGTTVIWGAVYMLKMFREAFFGEPRDVNAQLPDMKLFGRESVALAVLLALALVIGLMPNAFLSLINPDAQAMVGHYQAVPNQIAAAPTHRSQIADLPPAP